MAKGNDGNYLQHCIEVEAALRLVDGRPSGKLHIALTHGMMPFERFDAAFDEPKPGLTRKLLKAALQEANEPPRRKERPIVSAYRKTQASQSRYPNTGELLRSVVGTGNLSGGITETCAGKVAALRQCWRGSHVTPCHSSWRKQIDNGGVLACPDRLRTPWLFSMDPMTYCERGYEDDGKLYRADMSRLSAVLTRYVASGQDGIATLFVYAVWKKHMRQFWRFIDELAQRCGMRTRSCWLTHRGGNRNLAGILYSGVDLSGFEPPGLCIGRE